MTTTYGRKMERGNKWLATLQWYDRVPSHLNYERRFWVGPLNQCIHLLPSCREVRRETEPWCADVCQRRLGPRSSNDPAPPSSSTVPPLGLSTPPALPLPGSKSSTAPLTLDSSTAPGQPASPSDSSDDGQHTLMTEEQEMQIAEHRR